MRKVHNLINCVFSVASERGEEDDGQAESLHRGHLLHQRWPDQSFWGKTEPALMLQSVKVQLHKINPDKQHE